MKKLLLVIGLVISGMATQANAYEVKDLCAKYETNYSWSKGYGVQAQIYKGQELNKAVGSYNQYTSYKHYAVIWWDSGQASIIKLNLYSPGMMLYNTKGTDQNGRSWQLSDNNIGYCY